MKAALYIHIPFCRSKCSYCDFFSVPCGEEAVPDGYVSALCAEAAARAAGTGVSGWKSVYIGGGTPSLLSARQLLRIMETVRRLSPAAADFEATVEANPADISESFLDACAAAGIARLSCGVQALDGGVLAGVRRRGSLDDVRRALRLVSRQWRGVFSADMIAALPGQTEPSFLAGLSELLEYGPSHISLYSLSIEEGTPLARAVAGGRVPYDYDAADALWISGRDFLLESGFVQYEVSNFRRRRGGRECAHNLAYWRLRDYIGVGAGAVGTTYARQAVRCTNTSDIGEYCRYWNACGRRQPSAADAASAPAGCEAISDGDQQFEFFMMGFRTAEGVCAEAFERRFGRPVPAAVLSLHSDWERRGLAVSRVRGGRHFYALNKDGLLFLNRFLSQL